MEGDSVVIPVMRDRVPEGGYISRTGERQVESRHIKFLGFRNIDGVKHCLICAVQYWTTEYQMKMEAESGLTSPAGEQWKMLIPYNELQIFFKSIEGLDEDKNHAEENPVVAP